MVGFFVELLVCIFKLTTLPFRPLKAAIKAYERMRPGSWLILILVVLSAYGLLVYAGLFVVCSWLIENLLRPLGL